MPNTALVIDIVELFQKTFGRKPYVVPGISTTTTDSSAPGYRVGESVIKGEQEFTAKGSLIAEKYRGIEVLLPISFYDGPALLQYMPYCVLRVSGKKTIIETALAERTGSVKEQFNIDDYTINVKGFLISEDRKFPESEIALLNTLYRTQKAVTIENALTNIFLGDPNSDEQRRVVVYDFDLPEVQGGRIHVRPFTMTLKSDNVFTLELENFA